MSKSRKGLLTHMNVIETEGLTKIYGDTGVAVDSVNLIVERGSAFGLLGPIGAGKSTIINMLMNFIKPTAGTIKILDCQVPSQFYEAQERIGYLPERPGFYTNLSADRNLTYFARLSGIREDRQEKVRNVLSLVGLEGKEDLPVRAYSLGARKRLGIAAAMLNSPELLILDAPSTGLDLQGMKDITALIHDLKVKDVTMLLASHNVKEVAEICDTVGVIKSGRLMMTSSTKKFLADIRGETAQLEVELAEISDVVIQAIKSVEGVQSIECEKLSVILKSRPGINEDVNDAIVKAGGRIRSLRESPSLEEAYIRMTEGETLE
jgi:ABC-2 type transport system ATP-binding protein